MHGLLRIYGAVLLGTVHLQDAQLWLVCYEAATVLLLVTVLTWSTSASTRYHLALSYMFGVSSMSSAAMALWWMTGRTTGLYVALLIKLAVGPYCCSRSPYWRTAAC